MSKMMEVTYSRQIVLMAVIMVMSCVSVLSVSEPEQAMSNRDPDGRQRQIVNLPISSDYLRTSEKRLSEFLGGPGKRSYLEEEENMVPIGYLRDNNEKRLSEFLGGPGKRLSEFLGGPGKRYSEFLGGPGKRVSEFLGGPGKRFSEFLGGPGKRVSEFLGGPGKRNYLNIRYPQFYNDN
ncbi:helicostatins-like [Centruroides vittatus]|uniref:helicostatins-like n=1 Tax=Centruroides vittatus TaxID=120091 RepID=UPI00351089EB